MRENGLRFDGKHTARKHHLCLTLTFFLFFLVNVGKKLLFADKEVKAAVKKVHWTLKNYF